MQFTSRTPGRISVRSRAPGSSTAVLARRTARAQRCRPPIAPRRCRRRIASSARYSGFCRPIRRSLRARGSRRCRSWVGGASGTGRISRGRAGAGCLDLIVNQTPRCSRPVGLSPSATKKNAFVASTRVATDRAGLGDDLLGRRMRSRRRRVEKLIRRQRAGARCARSRRGPGLPIRRTSWRRGRRLTLTPCCVEGAIFN